MRISHRPTIFGFVSLLALGAVASTSRGDDEVKKVANDPAGETINARDPRARPLFYILVATLDSDIDLFKFAFSPRVSERIKEKDWPRGLAVYQRQLKEQLGDYKLEDLSKVRFRFQGTETEGRLSIVDRKGKSDATLRIIKTAAGWKLNER